MRNRFAAKWKYRKISEINFSIKQSEAFEYLCYCLSWCCCCWWCMCAKKMKFCANARFWFATIEWNHSYVSHSICSHCDFVNFISFTWYFYQITSYVNADTCPMVVNDKSERRSERWRCNQIENKEQFRENVVPFLVMLTIDFNFESSLCFHSFAPPRPKYRCGALEKSLTVSSWVEF